MRKRTISKANVKMHKQQSKRLCRACIKIKPNSVNIEFGGIKQCENMVSTSIYIMLSKHILCEYRVPTCVDARFRTEWANAWISIPQKDSVA